MTREERELAITYLEEMKEDYIEGAGYERHPLPEYYAIETAIKALEQEPTGWIPVSERLPEDGERVLVWYQYWRYGEYNNWFQTYGIGYVIDDRWSVIDGGIKTTVFAWLPLPEPYKESEDKE